MRRILWLWSYIHNISSSNIMMIQPSKYQYPMKHGINFVRHNRIGSSWLCILPKKIISFLLHHKIMRNGIMPYWNIFPKETLKIGIIWLLNKGMLNTLIYHMALILTIWKNMQLKRYRWIYPEILADRNKPYSMRPLFWRTTPTRFCT